MRTITGTITFAEGRVPHVDYTPFLGDKARDVGPTIDTPAKPLDLIAFTGRSGRLIFRSATEEETKDGKPARQYFVSTRTRIAKSVKSSVLAFRTRDTDTLVMDLQAVKSRYVVLVCDEENGVSVIDLESDKVTRFPYLEDYDVWLATLQDAELEGLPIPKWDDATACYYKLDNQVEAIEIKETKPFGSDVSSQFN